MLVTNQSWPMGLMVFITTQQQVKGTQVSALLLACFNGSLSHLGSLEAKWRRGCSLSLKAPQHVERRY
ncbi:hypothetical protein NC653_027761 [Populus alba x Populus x berolinensis]|uniref:Uncharacterized protein n=1 Tax=Populus alba x Populus x berolinensis TaxID=444605 RepID=A0AAD6Q592_9ROSI|nr:hypothetical protein NC653_027761 [Populus alba x Populus x berolinensis]